MKRESLLGLMLSGATLLAGFSGSALAQDALTEPQLRAKLEAQGYTKINDVKFVDGVWKADARSANGDRVDLRIDAKTGEIFPDEQIANLSEADVRAQLATAGYTNVHDVDYEDGIWNAEADDPTGKDVELKIDPGSGRVIGKEKD
ncbi:MAG TPA: PepSY domain-containing protein [Lysobacter sp.]|nr:PepSY domain-containing protein [Lysobacter sp.]